ncbi:24674_t:CDS:2, partial [Gigaspora rosea]
MQPLSPCVITSQLGFGGCRSPRSSLNNLSPVSQPKSSRIVQSFLSSVLQLTSNSTNSPVEFKKREFIDSKIDQSNQKSLLSEMLKRNVDLKDINQTLHGRPIMIKKPCNLIIETDKSTTKRELGSSNDTTLVNEKKVLKFGNCPLVVRERSSSIHLNDDSSKSDSSTAESSQTNPTIVVHKRLNHLSPLPITKKGIPIPSSNTNNFLGSRSHHYGSRDKFNRRKHCHRHNHHHSDEKI